MSKLSNLLLLSFFFILLLSIVVETSLPSTWKLFGFDTSGSYQPSNNYGSYYSQSRPRYNYGRSQSDGGGNRYKSICHVHAAGTEGFPGRIGNPVCPY